MAEHWCKEHQTVWFKKGKMKGYAHPIKDENGEDTDKWCNEPEEKVAKASKPNEMSKSDWSEKDRLQRQSIEQQVAVKAIVELIVAGKLAPDGADADTARNWIMSKLGNWSSTGPPPETEAPKEPMSTKEQRAKILSTYKERGYSDSLALSVMIRHYTVSESKKLTKKQASEFIRVLESGKYLEELSEEVEPTDIPFEE